MEEIEKKIEKNIMSLCKYLFVHEETWKSALEKALPVLKNLSNLQQQMASLSRIDFKYFDKDMIITTKINISKRIEEELESLKNILNTLHKTNNEMRNRVLTLENSSLDLNWECGSLLLTGTWNQPPLEVLLEYSLAFMTVYINTYKNMNKAYKSLSFHDESSMKELQNSFQDPAIDSSVVKFMALTQYIINPDSIT